MIKAICFDLDGVFFTTKGKNSFHNGLINEYAIEKDKIDFIMYKSPEMAQLVRGQITPQKFWEKFLELTNINATPQELTDRWIRDYEIDEEVLNAVKSAKEKGYKTCVCTNNNAIRLPLLIEKYKLNELFDVIVSSHEVGFAKPDKLIFQALLDKLKVQPEELVYSDDNFERLGGAKELGINTFQFCNFEQFLEELRELGVNL